MLSPKGVMEGWLRDFNLKDKKYLMELKYNLLGLNNLATIRLEDLWLAEIDNHLVAMR